MPLTPVNWGGHPNNPYSEPAQRLNVRLPAGMVRAIQQEARGRSQIPGQVVVGLLSGVPLQSGAPPLPANAPTAQLNLLLPVSTVRSIQQQAQSQGQSPGEVLAARLRPAFPSGSPDPGRSQSAG